MEWRRISVLHADWVADPGFNLVIRRSLVSDYKTLGELSDAEAADPECIRRVPGIGKVATAAVKNILTRYRNGVAPEPFYRPEPRRYEPPATPETLYEYGDDDILEPVIIPAQPGWFAKRTSDGLHYQPVIAWVIVSVTRIDDEPRAIGALSGKLDAGWTLEYNARPNPWHE